MVVWLLLVVLLGNTGVFAAPYTFTSTSSASNPPSPSPSPPATGYFRVYATAMYPVFNTHLLPTFVVYGDYDPGPDVASIIVETSFCTDQPNTLGEFSQTSLDRAVQNDPRFVWQCSTVPPGCPGSECPDVVLNVPAGAFTAVSPGGETLQSMAASVTVPFRADFQLGVPPYCGPDFANVECLASPTPSIVQPTGGAFSFAVHSETSVGRPAWRAVFTRDAVHDGTAPVTVFFTPTLLTTLVAANVTSSAVPIVAYNCDTLFSRRRKSAWFVPGTNTLSIRCAAGVFADISFAIAGGAVAFNTLDGVFVNSQTSFVVPFVQSELFPVQPQISAFSVDQSWRVASAPSLARVLTTVRTTPTFSGNVFSFADAIRPFTGSSSLLPSHGGWNDVLAVFLPQEQGSSVFSAPSQTQVNHVTCGSSGCESASYSTTTMTRLGQAPVYVQQCNLVPCVDISVVCYGGDTGETVVVSATTIPCAGTRALPTISATPSNQPSTSKTPASTLSRTPTPPPSVSVSPRASDSAAASFSATLTLSRSSSYVAPSTTPSRTVSPSTSPSWTVSRSATQSPSPSKLFIPVIVSVDHPTTPGDGTTVLTVSMQFPADTGTLPATLASNVTTSNCSTTCLDCSTVVFGTTLFVRCQPPAAPVAASVQLVGNAVTSQASGLQNDAVQITIPFCPTLTLVPVSGTVSWNPCTDSTIACVNRWSVWGPPTLVVNGSWTWPGIVTSLGDLSLFDAAAPNDAIPASGLAVSTQERWLQIEADTTVMPSTTFVIAVGAMRCGSWNTAPKSISLVLETFSATPTNTPSPSPTPTTSTSYPMSSSESESKTASASIFRSASGSHSRSKSRSASVIRVVASRSDTASRSKTSSKSKTPSISKTRTALRTKTPSRSTTKAPEGHSKTRATTIFIATGAVGGGLFIVIVLWIVFRHYVHMSGWRRLFSNET